MTTYRTETVTPLDLKVGDKVLAYGALLQVEHITEARCTVEGGIRVAACQSRILEGNGATIATSPWSDTAEDLTARGCTWAKDLPPGRYWNVQGNAHARVYRVIG